MENKYYKLRILPLFGDDLNEVVDYIFHRLRNPLAAEDMVDFVQESIRVRLPCAKSSEPYPSIKERETSYYRIYIKNDIIVSFAHQIVAINRFEKPVCFSWRK